MTKYTCIQLIVLICSNSIGLNNLFASERLPPANALLQSMVTAEGADYRAIRDSLINDSDAILDVAVLARDSWGIGLAALIVNERRAHREDFAVWDDRAKTASTNAGGVTFRYLPYPPEPSQTAFLLELVWKFPGRAEAAYEDLVIAPSRTASGPTEMWMSIWQNCSEVKLQDLAIMGLTRNPGPNPVVYEELGAILFEPTSLPRHKGLVLTGFYWNPTSQAIQILKDNWRRLKADKGMLPLAASVLGRADDADSRQMLYDVIRDNIVSTDTRIRVLEACTRHPQQTDVVVFDEFMGLLKSSLKKKRVVSLLEQYSYEEAAPTLRKLLAADDLNPHVGASALLAFKRIYTKGALQDLKSIQLDRDVMEQCRIRMRDEANLMRIIDDIEAKIDQAERPVQERE